MEAKDTIMTLSEIRRLRLSLLQAVNRQAEISFKAGIKELASFITKKNRAGGTYFGAANTGKNQWLKTVEFQLTEDELKEWGL